MITGRRIYLCTALAGLAVVAAAWLSPQAVPLYDGVGFPDQPYVFADPSQPPNQQPIAARQPVAQPQLTGGITLQSPETGPQLKAVFAPGSITLTGSASETVLTAIPMAPGTQPPTARIVSNIYRLAASASPAPQVRTGFATVYLRLPQRTPPSSGPAMIYRPPNGNWTTLATNQTGADIFAATFQGWGDYALALGAKPASSGHNASASASHLRTALAIAALIVGAIIMLLLIIRLAGRKSHAPHHRP